MTKRDKLFLKFLENPNSFRFSKIEKILYRLNFEKVQVVRGSHHKYTNKLKKIKFIIPVHQNDCPFVYKKDIATILEKFFSQINYEKNI